MNKSLESFIANGDLQVISGCLPSEAEKKAADALIPAHLRTKRPDLAKNHAEKPKKQKPRIITATVTGWFEGEITGPEPDVDVWLQGITNTKKVAMSEAGIFLRSGNRWEDICNARVRRWAWDERGREMTDEEIAGWKMNITIVDNTPKSLLL